MTSDLRSRSKSRLQPALVDRKNCETFLDGFIRRLTSHVGSGCEAASPRNGNCAGYKRLIAALFERICGASPLPAGYRRLAQYKQRHLPREGHALVREYEGRGFRLQGRGRRRR